MQEQINFTPINLLIQQIKSAELSKAKEIKIPIEQARLLALTLTDVSIRLNQSYESLLAELKQSTAEESISVQVDGGEF